MKTTKSLVVLTTETKTEINVNEHAHGVMTRTSGRTYKFVEDGLTPAPVAGPVPARKYKPCPEQKWNPIAETQHARACYNAFGVAVFMYFKHTEYTSRAELIERLEDETYALTKQIRKRSANGAK